MFNYRKRSRIVAAALGVALVAGSITLGGAEAQAATHKKTALSAAVSAASLVAGQGLAVHGTLKSAGHALKKAKVAVQTSTPGTKWLTVARTRTNAKGKYAVAFTPKSGVYVRAKFAGAKRIKAKTSSVKTVSLTAPLANVTYTGAYVLNAGDPMGFTGWTTPFLAGQIVSVQAFVVPASDCRYCDAPVPVWTDLIQSRIAGNGSFSVPFTTGSSGDIHYRVSIPTAAGIIGTAGPETVVTSYAWYALGSRNATEANNANTTASISLGGNVYTKSITGTSYSGASYIGFDIAGKCKELKMTQGIQDSESTTASARFAVKLDNNYLPSSDVTWGTPQSVDMAIPESTLRLRLEATHLQPSYWVDLGWGSPQVLCRF